MNRPAIIFFDIDGTLLDFGKKDLSPKTREALLKLRANGIRICIATGRSPLAVPKFEGVEFDAYLTYNGCYCYEGSKTIYSNPMSLEDVQTIIQNAASMERALSVATKDRLISNGTDPDLEEYYAFGNQKVTISDEVYICSPCRGDSILFTGGTGVGKTFLTNCIAKELIDRCISVIYLSSPGLRLLQGLRRRRLPGFGIPRS